MPSRDAFRTSALRAKRRVRRVVGVAFRQLTTRRWNHGHSASTSEPSEGGEVWRSPPVPVPNGWSLSQIEAMLRSWSVDGEPPGHLAAYVDDSLWRFLHTWGLVRTDLGRCLELGVNPYFTTYLLSNHTDLDITLGNFYGQTRAFVYVDMAA